MAIFVGVGRTDECSNNKKEEKEKNGNFYRKLN